MDFHCVDTAAPRFQQAVALYVFRIRIEPSGLRDAFDQLLLAWPILRRNISFWRIRAFTTDDTTTYWQSRIVDAPLAECIPFDCLGKEDLGELERRNLEEQFQFPQSLKSQMFPPICRLQAVHYQDGCLLKFTVQHVFCDGAGLHRIVSAFASLLRGETIEPIEEARPSRILFQAPKQGSDSPDPLSEQLYHASCRQWATGVGRMSLYGIAQWLARVCSRSPRSLRTMHIASPILDRLDDLARKQKVQVTRHDLLMAIIAQATIKAFPELSTRPIGFMYNFNHHLDKPAPLHNPFWPISIPLAQGIDKLHGDEQLIMLASQVRQAVRAARSPECLELFREKYESMGPWQPLHPANLNPNRPNIQVSSSSHLNWYDISFGPGIKPYYTHLHVPVIDFVTLLGWEYHDLILTTKDKETSGFCIHGSLHTEVWRWLEHICDPLIPAPSRKEYARL